MDKLSPSTLDYILKLLKEQKEESQYTMIQAIESNYSEEVIKSRIKKFQEAHKVYCEFDDWVDELCDNDTYA